VFDDAGLERICEYADLESLNASNSAITDAGLNNLKSQSGLEWLFLMGTKVTDIGLAPLADCRNLGNLYLNETAVTGRGLASVASLSNVLNLTSCPVTAEGVECIVTLNRVKALCFLGCSTFDDRCATIVSRMTNLRHLNLSGTSVTASGVDQLGKLVELNELSLEWVKLADSTLQELINLKSLEFLNVANTGLSDMAIGTIADLPFLQRLVLQGTAVTDAGLPHLAKLEDLYELHLEGTKVTKEGVAKLQEALPDCEIFSDVAPPFTFMPTTPLAPASPSKTDADGTSSKPLDQNSAPWHGWPADAPAPAIAPFDEEQARKHQQAWADYLKLPLEHTNTIGMKFILIPPGEFLMGSTQEEIEEALKQIDPNWSEYVRSEAPRHNVVLTRPFYTSVHEVTQKEYEAVMGVTPSNFSKTGPGEKQVAGLETENFPVELVSWNDAAEFCATLSEQEDLKPFYFRGDTVTGLKGTGYRLLTEAEWEFACRAGTTTSFSNGDKSPAGWFVASAGRRTHEVQELAGNPFGLFDVHGNVWEWVEDSWEPAFYERFAKKPALEPKCASSDGSSRVARGGSWLFSASDCRSARRQAWAPHYCYYDIGFRIALVIDALRRDLPAPKPSAAASPANSNAP
jgi:formylglycine-generating enzyme required for sulfatase activity